MEIIYSKSDYTDKEQVELMRQMDYVHSRCVGFRLSCYCYDDRWGLWLTVGNNKWLVDPIELINSLFVGDVYCIFMPYERMTWESRCVDIRKEAFCMTWSANHPDSPIKGALMFRFDEYIDRITASVGLLYEVMKAGGTVCYSELDLDIEVLEMAVAQLKIKSALPNVCRLRTCDVVEERFEFTPFSCEECRIGIGDRHFKTSAPYDGYDWELMRHQLESVFYGEDAIIMIDYDFSETILRIEHRHILDELIRGDNGYRYTYKEYAKVTIQDKSSELKPIIIVGYCNYKDTIRTIYEGLLRMALLHSEVGYDHTPGRIEAYNMCKSPLVESFLNDNKRDSSKSSTRQVRITSIVTIEPDYDSYLIDEYERAIDLGELLDKQGNPIEMPELEIWHSEIKHLVVEAAVGRDAAFDWADWHRRGIELAKQLRKQLPSCYDLWYSAPSEDKGSVIRNKILII